VREISMHPDLVRLLDITVNLEEELQFEISAGLGFSTG
jgi:hypothetical protein